MESYSLNKHNKMEKPNKIDYGVAIHSYTRDLEKYIEYIEDLLRKARLLNAINNKLNNKG